MGRNGELLLNVYKDSVWGAVLGIESGDGCTPL